MDAAAKFPPVLAAVVLVIVNVTPLGLGPPPGEGLTTVIVAVPGDAMRADGTVAVSCVALTNVVTRLFLFQTTTEPTGLPALCTKFVPFTVN